MRIASHSLRSRSVHGFGRQSPARADELTEWELAFAGTWMPTAAAAARMRPGTTPYPVWKSNFGRPTPSTRYFLRGCVCSLS